MLREVVAAGTDDGRITEDAAEALHVALRYFRNAAPRHTQDEEESLFPRMRESDDPRVTQVLERIEQLEHEHAEVQPLHVLVDDLGTRWLETGVLSARERSMMGDALSRLQSMYAEHIAAEDTLVFPLAREVLGADAQVAVGTEMRARRAPR
jgi:iron-sulfur cluster repair protein YtfE (RIC family)